MERQGVSDELKARSQMVSVGAVNNIRNVFGRDCVKRIALRVN